MEKLEQFLSLPENRQGAYDASAYVLQAVAPEEASISEAFISPRLDMVADGEITAVEAGDEAGGFGASDLMVMVVTPAVVAALSTIITHAGVKTLADLKQEQISEKEIRLQISEEIEVVIKLTKPSLKQRHVNRLAKRVQDAVMAYLLAEDGPLQEGYRGKELGRLRRQINEHYNDSELQNLCVDLGINYEVLGPGTKQDKVRGLVLYCQRHDRVSDLINSCRLSRPHVAW